MYANKNNDEELIDAAITLAEDEHTVMAKSDITNLRRVTTDAAHTATHKNKISNHQREKYVGHAIKTETRRLINSIKRDGKHVKFRRNPTIATFYNDNGATMLTYNSGEDGHYLSKKDIKKLGLPILRVSAKKVGVANGGACNVKYVTKLSFPKISNKASEEDTLQ